MEKAAHTSYGPYVFTFHFHLEQLCPSRWFGRAVADSKADPDAEPAPKEKFYSATVSIRAMLRFLTSHLVGGTAIACESALDTWSDSTVLLGSGYAEELTGRSMRGTLRHRIRLYR